MVFFHVVLKSGVQSNDDPAPGMALVPAVSNGNGSSPFCVEPRRIVTTVTSSAKPGHATESCFLLGRRRHRHDAQIDEITNTLPTIPIICFLWSPDWWNVVGPRNVRLYGIMAFDSM